MQFITYENRNNPHVAIHFSRCNQIKKRGGKHKDGKVHYKQHKTYQDAVRYAKSLNLLKQDCSFCKPQKL